MAQGKITSLDKMSSHLTKIEKSSREEADRAVAGMIVAKRPRPAVTLTKEERKIFNRFTKLNTSFTEADSTSLSLLATALYRYEEIKEAIQSLDVFDERNITLERRALAYDKAISQHMNALSIPLNQRYKLANDMAKVMIEEKKLQQMEQQNQPRTVNPLLAILEDDEDE